MTGRGEEVGLALRFGVDEGVGDTGLGVGEGVVGAVVMAGVGATVGGAVEVGGCG